MNITMANTGTTSTLDYGTLANDPSWLALKLAATDLAALQVKDGSVPEPTDHGAATAAVDTIKASITSLAPHFAWACLTSLIPSWPSRRKNTASMA